MLTKRITEQTKVNGRDWKVKAWTIEEKSKDIVRNRENK